MKTFTETEEQDIIREEKTSPIQPKKLVYFALLIAAIFFYSPLSAIMMTDEYDCHEGYKIEKVYIDPDDFSTQTIGDNFHIHIGGNQWVETNTIHRDSTGLFAYVGNIRQKDRKWKCPYCFHLWPMGSPCQNKDCPSRY